ncbi:sensor histidine kinase [Streptomyces geranii]|uniref:sensor histidine kinase n=1 Tax=Streptomyces geranii TaxID=2058923 RepID=UPI000D035ABA|nr:histidine kinase [Streptomyces geranii]
MSTNWQRRAATRPRAVEAVTLVLLFAATVFGVVFTRAVLNETPLLWPAVALSALACAALYRRRDHPVQVLAVTLLCTMGLGTMGYLLTPGLMGPLLVALYSTSVRTSRRTTWNSALTAAAGMIVAGLFLPSFPNSLILALVNPAAWTLLSAVFGSYVRVRREYAVARTEHAAREREEEARHRVIQERMRIARELHDVVAHHLTLADAQAATAAHIARTDPDKAFEIVARLPESTAAALRELKATVGLLHQDTDPADELHPAPGLGQLPDLIDACSAAGLEVTVTTEGRPHPLTPVLDLTAYRILQEALTNVTKHATTRTARVALSYSRRRLTLTVTNDTPSDRPTPARSSSGGFGLLSMRERAAAVGGTFHAGRRAQGAFEVTCVLPLTGIEGGHDDSHDDSNDEGLAP